MINDTDKPIKLSNNELKYVGFSNTIIPAKMNGKNNSITKSNVF